MEAVTLFSFLYLSREDLAVLMVACLCVVLSVLISPFLQKLIFLEGGNLGGVEEWGQLAHLPGEHSGLPMIRGRLTETSIFTLQV